VTYIIVFTLNNIADYCNGLYESFQMKVVDRMKGEGPEEMGKNRWSDRAERFRSFGPKKSRQTPSAWRILM
jgi:hypothetical protein